METVATEQVSQGGEMVLYTPQSQGGEMVLYTPQRKHPVLSLLTKTSQN